MHTWIIYTQYILEITKLLTVVAAVTIWIVFVSSLKIVVFSMS